MSILKVGLVQQTCSTNRDENIRKSIAGIRECANKGAELIVLQELHTGIYFCQVEDPDIFDLAESIPGPSTDIFSRVAKECGIVLVTSLFERRAPGIYHNTAVVFDKDG
ncbi:MAG TPA: nitrilase-related carbon-nitrogen hydrolase, partial [Saprospiraceae bacterium]|nr:nitrilase-related carbon-nitrogen hydrolase [Saprospiraceae bacterium]